MSLENALHELETSASRRAAERDLSATIATTIGAAPMHGSGGQQQADGSSYSSPSAAAEAAAATATTTAVASLEEASVVVELREQVARAREHAEVLEERLDETVRRNNRLEREVAEAVELGVRAVKRVSLC